MRLQIKASDVFHLLTGVGFSSEVKTERIILQPRVLHIHSHEVGSIRKPSFSDFCQTFVFSTLFTAGLHTLSPGPIPAAVGRKQPWELKENVNTGGMMEDTEKN